ncbi:MAG: L-aspartate oxidase [Gammaproteobacteria bacterium]|nr:L-aspartate oxidase [Gammaproteobacteria bacterium]
MSQKKPHIFDVLIIGSGGAGLSLALRLPKTCKIAILSKGELEENATYHAQGGIAAVLDNEDSINSHIEDTLKAGAGMCDKDAVRFTVEHGPEAIQWLINQGVNFTRKIINHKRIYHLTREGGHSHRRIIHAADSTGKEVELTMLDRAKEANNISLFRHHIAIDLIKQDKNCVGAYVYNEPKDKCETFLAKATVLATGGASRLYLYSSNPAVASGDGIAMGHRIGCKINDMEFNQFHPTCLYHPQAGSFLITEAMRGEGAYLLLPDGTRFMPKVHPLAELAPRDIVARAIDYEMKLYGLRHVYLDISHKDSKFIKNHFPGIYRNCLKLGIDITKEPMPVVPAAHYTCGGIKVDLKSRTNIKGLYAIGEVSCTGLHGANRIASNSLLECMVFAKAAAEDIAQNLKYISIDTNVNPWDESWVTDSNEEVFVTHNWEEIRTFMWDYVGIVRSNKRLARAQHRINMLKKEIQEYYGNFRITKNLIELRNLIVVAELTVKAATLRQENRGLHYSLDY